MSPARITVATFSRITSRIDYNILYCYRSVVPSRRHRRWSPPDVIEYPCYINALRRTWCIGCTLLWRQYYYDLREPSCLDHEHDRDDLYARTATAHTRARKKKKRRIKIYMKINNKTASRTLHRRACENEILIACTDGRIRDDDDDGTDVRAERVLPANWHWRRVSVTAAAAAALRVHTARLASAGAATPVGWLQTFRGGRAGSAERVVPARCTRTRYARPVVLYI